MKLSVLIVRRLNTWVLSSHDFDLILLRFIFWKCGINRKRKCRFFAGAFFDMDFISDEISSKGYSNAESMMSVIVLLFRTTHPSDWHCSLHCDSELFALMVLILDRRSLELLRCKLWWECDSSDWSSSLGCPLAVAVLDLSTTFGSS